MTARVTYIPHISMTIYRDLLVSEVQVSDRPDRRFPAHPATPARGAAGRSTGVQRYGLYRPLARGQGFDTAFIFEQHRRNLEDGIGLLETLFDGGLAFVGCEDLGITHPGQPSPHPRAVGRMGAGNREGAFGAGPRLKR